MSAQEYVLGHSPAELQRLRVQGEFFADITREAFIEAGLRPGSRVLDIGCGAGDVSFLVSDLVKPAGAVVGIDRSSEAVAAARARAQSSGASNVEFHVGAIDASVAHGTFDAVVGRFVLMHQQHGAEILRAAARHVRPGGLVIMIESVFGACAPGLHSYPHSCAYDALLVMLRNVIRAVGADDMMGLRLVEVFTAAGLDRPQVRMRARVDSGPDAARLVSGYLAECLRSVRPLATSLGVDDCTSQRIDQLETELTADASNPDAVFVSPPIVAAWCRHLY